jgi:aminopeptidase N
VATLRSGAFAKLTESLPRALLWSAAWDMTRDGELATRDYLALVLAGIDQEDDIGVLQSLTRQVQRALEIYADPAWAPEGYAAIAAKAHAALRSAQPGSDLQLAWTHALLSSMSSTEHVDFARGLLDGTETVAGLAVDDELRWSIVQALSALGAIDDEGIDAERERDPSAAGQRAAATARALRPSAESKAEAWHLAVEDDSLPNAMQSAVINGFSHWTQGELLRPYMQRYFDEVAGVWERRTSELAQNVVMGLAPTWTSTCTPETVAAADAFLAREDLPSALRRLVGEARADVIRAISAREADAAGGLPT